MLRMMLLIEQHGSLYHGTTGTYVENRLRNITNRSQAKLLGSLCLFESLDIFFGQSHGSVFQFGLSPLLGKHSTAPSIFCLGECLANRFNQAQVGSHRDGSSFRMLLQSLEDMRLEINQRYVLGI